MEAGLLVTAIRDVKLGKGATGPHLLECDDGMVYLVKFMDHTRTLINEYVGHSVADILGVSVPRSSYIFVPEDLIGASADLKVRGIKPGVHFGSLWENDSIDLSGVATRDLMNLPPAALARLPGFIVFDNLVLNWDRNNIGNSLLRKTKSGEYEFESIDFNEILAGPRWTLETLNLVEGTSNLMPALPIMLLSVNGVEPFSPWLEATEAISEGVMYDMLAKVPSSWNINDQEREAIAHFILTRRALVRGILTSHRNAFANWR